jgi:hypothetical protein
LTSVSLEFVVCLYISTSSSGRLMAIFPCVFKIWINSLFSLPFLSAHNWSGGRGRIGEIRSRVRCFLYCERSWSGITFECIWSLLLFSMFSHFLSGTEQVAKQSDTPICLRFLSTPNRLEPGAGTSSLLHSTLRSPLGTANSDGGREYWESLPNHVKLVVGSGTEASHSTFRLRRKEHHSYSPNGSILASSRGIPGADRREETHYDKSNPAKG